MNLQDFLYLSLAVGFLILVGFISFAAFRLGKTLESIKRVVDNAEDITHDVKAVKDQIKSGLITTIMTALNLTTAVLKRKGGGKIGK
ncbi:MAG: hypothetical protein Q7S79_03540 [bacterium]|nr:hypothetical protein [bacterium]